MASETPPMVQDDRPKSVSEGPEASLREYAQHKPECPADDCRICGTHKTGQRLPDGTCSTDKYGTHDWEGYPCTCGLSALLVPRRS